MRFADVIVIKASSAVKLQRLLSKTRKFWAHYGFKINVKKIKYMVMINEPNIKIMITFLSRRIERVRLYKYLGTWITENNNETIEIRTKIKPARNAFVKL